MQKVVDFLEKNVQWLVLGLGGVIFLLMVWWYVVQPPVTVQVSGKQVLPGEIDQQTVQGPVSNFKRAIQPGQVEIPWVEPTYYEDFVANAKPNEMKYTELAKLLPAVKPPLPRVNNDQPTAV